MWVQVPSPLPFQIGKKVRLKKNKKIVCADGFAMSVQADEGAYCSPRNDRGPYEEAEIGFPTEKEDLIMPYVEDHSCPTETVYAYVPKNVITMVIAKHGGIVSGELPEGMLFLRAQMSCPRNT